MDLTDELIVDFRETVNSNSGFVFHLYHSKEGNNYWNIICSCMDWISVSVRFLSKDIVPDENVDVRVMQFFSVISAIDIVFESVVQLHRVIYQNNKIPFKGIHEIFKGNKLELDDNDYFKEIRAMFGAHPVNLKGQGNQKWFACWPYDHLTTNKTTFELRLYSNKVGVRDLTFGVHINELQNFLLQRYKYLTDLKKEIIRQYDSFCKDMASQSIEASDSSYELVLILERESAKRLNNKYYNGVIYELKKIYSTTLNEDRLAEEETEYKIILRKLIDELHRKLQAMSFTDLKFDKYLNPDYSYSDIGYSVSKLFTCEFKREQEPLFDFHMNELDKYSSGHYRFSKTRNPDQIFLKLKMMLFKMSKNNDVS
jgi:hypothetical protein